MSYDFTGRSMELQPDGSVVIASAPSEGSETITVSEVQESVTVIETPWAKDRLGRSVNTEFVVNGSRLTQVMKPTSETAYPVVADPYIAKKWYGYQIRFYKSETQRVAYGAAACTALLNLAPHPVTKALAKFCGSLTVWAAGAMAFGKCMAVNVYYYSGAIRALNPWYWSC